MLARVSRARILCRPHAYGLSQLNNFRSLSTEASYTEQQMKKGRPVSPHVTIYKFPLAAISSITIRVTGVLLSVGVTGIGAISLLGIDAPSVMIAIGAVPVLSSVAKFGVSFPLIYHYLGGVRHMVWDRQPEQLINNESVEQASQLLIGGSLVLSALVTFLL